jgi:ribosome biogenesis GTPase
MFTVSSFAFRTPMNTTLDEQRSLPLSRLGWTPFFQRQLDALDSPLVPARVLHGARGVHHVLGDRGSMTATLGGRLLHRSHERAELPAVGDWVGVREGPPGGPSTIAHVFARRTCLLRKEAGKGSSAQVLAANVDAVMIVSALDADFNLRRLERYVDLVLESGARPLFVLNKADLCDEPQRFREAVSTIAPGAPVRFASALSGEGLDALQADLHPGETIALVGSSGVGKSSLANRLLGQALLREGEIRQSDQRGRHTTTHRELFPLAGGGLLIDTPGLRELSAWVSEGDRPAGFDDVEQLAGACRFRDCGHGEEPGCAVQRAVQEGTLDADRLLSFHKLGAERRFLVEKQDARAQANTKRRFKEIARSRRQLGKE